MSRESKASPLQKMPTKWAVAIVVALIGYTFLQPVLNQRLGWELPSLASLSEGSKESGNKPAAQGQETSNADQRPTSQKPQPSETNSGTNSSGLRYGILKELGNEEYLSPAGLRYTRGSEEGHRLKHIARHLEDQPNRENTHGVFYGDMTQVLRWIDDTYTRADAGEKGTSKKEERGRVVYEANFDKPIGFVGGKPGKRKGNPDARKLRLVTDERRVITAFPFQ